MSKIPARHNSIQNNQKVTHTGDAYREMRIFVLRVITCLFFLNWFYNIRMWYMRRFPRMRITSMRKSPSYQHTWLCLCITSLVKHSPTQSFYKQHERQSLSFKFINLDIYISEFCTRSTTPTSSTACNFFLFV